MSFAQILGQETAIAVLQNALRRQRMPHAYVFAGNEGVGKKLTALTLAKALNCRELADDAEIVGDKQDRHAKPGLQRLE
jgi:DNA polymerase-3 subunit delta'